MQPRRSQRFVPSALGESELENRLVLSSASIQVASIHAANFHSARPPVNPILGWVDARGTGVPQNALNFTSHTYHQILNGGAGVDGFRQIFNRYHRGGDFNRLNNDLARLAQRVPYGAQDLLPIWQDTLEGGTMVTAARAQARGWGANAANQAYGGIINQLRQTTADYINGGVGTRWNVLLSQVRTSSEWDLLYNGRAGRPYNPSGFGALRG